MSQKLPPLITGVYRSFSHPDFLMQVDASAGTSMDKDLSRQLAVQL